MVLLIVMFLLGGVLPALVPILLNRDAEHGTRRVDTPGRPDPSTQTPPQNSARCADSLQGNGDAQRNPASWKHPDLALDKVVEFWMAQRLVWHAASKVPARAAFVDFRDWCIRNQLTPPSMTAFGREFSAQIEHFGGRKVKRRQRAYYEGCRLDEESNR